MTVEQLMMPRYKVTNNWPSMRDFELHQVVTLDKEFSPQYRMWTITDCQGERNYITKFFDNYPHLFQPLPWWAERKVEDMPEYVKDGNGEVYKIKEWDNFSSPHIYVDTTIHSNWREDCTESILFEPF